MHVSNKGTVKACCVANIPFGNVNEQSMIEIWEGPAINKIRAKFANGQMDKRCGYCQKLEATGAKSIRQETFEKFPNFKIEEKRALPIYFDIRFSNVCNFRCRTCWHGASSKWFGDAQKLGTNIGTKAILTNIDDVHQFIETWGGALKGAEEIYFAGGEPLVTEEHYILLSWLIDEKINPKLRYNTNFSKLSFKDYDVLDLWNHFTSVEILASIDGEGALGEYIRKEMNWHKIIENRKILHSFDHIDFKISPTVSVFNVAHLPTLYKTCISQGLIDQNGIYINILERPNHYNIQILDPQKKASIIKIYHEFFSDLPNNEESRRVIESFNEILSYMNDKSDQSLMHSREKHWNTFLSETEKLDTLRMEDLSSFDLFL